MNECDAFAAAYARVNEGNPWNAHYERPAAMLRLLGEVEGRRLLDAGCGTGALAAALERGDLGEPLPVAATSFDLVAASRFSTSPIQRRSSASSTPAWRKLTRNQGLFFCGNRGYLGP